MRVRSEHSERNLFFSRTTLTVVTLSEAPSFARLLSSVIGTTTIFDALDAPTARHHLQLWSLHAPSHFGAVPLGESAFAAFS